MNTLKIKITKYIEIPIEFTATVTPAEKATHDYPGCEEEIQDINEVTGVEGVVRLMIAQIDKETDAIIEDLWLEVKRLKEEGGEEL